jgi:hypothetical protein
MYTFHKLVFDRGGSNIECFNREIHKVLLVVGSSQISYEGKLFLSLLNITRRENAYVVIVSRVA